MTDLKRKSQDLEELAKAVLARARAEQKVEVFSEYHSETNVVYERDDMSLSSRREHSSHGIRVIDEGRMGFASTLANEKRSVESAYDSALDMAKLSASSPHQQLNSDSSGPTEFEKIDSDLLHSDPAFLFQSLKFLVDEVLKEGKIALERVEMGLNIQTWGILNSLGVRRQARAAFLTWSAMGLGKTVKEITSFDYDGGNCTKKSEVQKGILATAEILRESLLSSFHPRKPHSYKGKVLLHPSAVMTLLGGTVAINASSIPQQDGASSWKDKRGGIVGSEMLNYKEDATKSEWPSRWTPFDREGVLTKPRTIVNEGKLDFVAFNCFSAHREPGQSTTGNAVGDSRSAPTLGFHGLSVEPSLKAKKMSLAELNRELSEGLVLKRFSGNKEPYGGSFSGVAKNSYWVENGERAFAVEEAMLSGNLFDLLKNVVATGLKPEDIMGSAQAPYVLVDGVSVSV